jgi:hypothetical protein
MTPIQNVTPNFAIDSAVPTLGIYYYVIVAGNATCWSTISNNQWVNVTAYPRPATPTLSPILPNVSYNGQIKLDWNDAQNATRYYVYKHTAPINPGNVGTLKPSVKVTASIYTDISFINGTFHYAIIAGNNGFNSSVSNSESVLVQRQPIPGTPFLNPIVPYPDYDGKIKLDWTDTINTTKYYVYRDTSLIISLSNRIPLAIVTQSNYTDTIAVNNTFYYVVMAGNLGFNGSMSVCRNVSVILYPLPGTPVLVQIIPGTDYDGIIKLDWADTVSTTKYFVYRDTALINNVNSLTPIATIFQSNFTNIITANATYFYVIVASNPSRNSSISNCRSVTVWLYSVPGIPTLNLIQPSPDYDGIIQFNWTSATSASKYYIYRELFPILNITSLQPFKMVTTTSFTDVITVNGTYYYAILASNPGHNATTCSNNQSVTVLFFPPPGKPFLDPILPSYNGTIRLNWNDTVNTLIYYLYKDTSIITSVLSRTPYAVVTQSNYTDFSAVNGTFFYAVVASNYGRNGSLSNCQSILVAIYPPPVTPTLNPIVPKINTYGIISLDWSDTVNTVRYFVYKSSSNISEPSEINSLSPLAMVTQSSYIYSELIDGTYYYVIVASNPSHNSSISNCENVTVNLYNPPGTPILNPIIPNLDYDGTVLLDWTDAVNATKYFIYQDTIKIANITNHLPVAVVFYSNYTTVLFVNATYFFVIVASNAKFNSSISNCENVTVVKYPIPGVPILSPIIPSTDFDGTILLNWIDTTNTIKYYVYKYTSLITASTIISLVPIAVVTQSSYTDVSPINNTFFYVIVAGNLGFNSSLSICRNVTIEIYPSILNPPILNPIAPLVSYDGLIHLSWSRTKNTATYYIFREEYLMISVAGLTPIAIVSQNYTDVVVVNRTYYYCIVAANPSHNSSMSNVRVVTIAIYSVPPFPTLYLIDPATDYDGIIHLDWSDTASTSRYYIFRENFSISDVNQLIPIAIVSRSEYTDVIGVNGTYYYVIVASNPSYNSTSSNCQSVTVAISTPPGPTKDFKWIIYVIVIAASAVAASLVVVKIRSRSKGRPVPHVGPKVITPKVKGIPPEAVSIEEKIRALRQNQISIETISDLADAQLTEYFSQPFMNLPKELIDFLQKLDAPIEDKLELIEEFKHLSPELKKEFLKELTEF